jgi:hypothetical protein
LNSNAGEVAVVSRWLDNLIIEALLIVAWQLTVRGVVEVFNYTKHSWYIVLVQFLESFRSIILNTIAVLVVDLGLFLFFLGWSHTFFLLERLHLAHSLVFGQVLWTVDPADIRLKLRLCLSLHE